MIPPFIVIHRSGADVIRDEALLHPVIRARFIERRRHRPMWWACNGFMAGICGSYTVIMSAQISVESPTVVSQWATPSGLMAFVSLLTMIFAFGQMWNARKEDRKAIQELKDSKASKESVDTMATTVNRVEDKLDRIIERIHEA